MIVMKFGGTSLQSARAIRRVAELVRRERERQPSAAPIPRAMPTPSTPPTSVCVVDTGMPRREARTIVVAAANSAAKPRLGVSSVIFLPTVSITR